VKSWQNFSCHKLLKNQMQKVERLFGIFFVVILVASCRTIKEPEYRGIDSFRITGIGVDTSMITLNLTYFNPNKYGLKIKEAEGDAYIDSIYLGHFLLDSLIKIPKSSDFTVPFLLKAKMKNIYSNALSVFASKEFNLRLEGKCKVGRGGLFFPYPIHYEGKQSLKLF
jgi:LEA14-like dessication related protein